MPQDHFRSTPVDPQECPKSTLGVPQEHRKSTPGVPQEFLGSTLDKESSLVAKVFSWVLIPLVAAQIWLYKHNKQ